MKRILFVISVLVLSVLACQMSGFTTPSQPQPTPVLPIDATAPALPTPLDPTEMGSTLEALYQSVLPGVVSIRTNGSGRCE